MDEIKVLPDKFGETIEEIIIPRQQRADLQEDIRYFEWNSRDNKEEDALASLAEATIDEWRSKDEDELWQ